MFVTIKESFQEGMKRARVKKVINMTKEARTEEEKKKIVQYMNDNGISVDDVRKEIHKINCQED